MQTQKGFTLVELSIVLIIIGLIISGVLTGKSLIRSARVNSIIKDIETYKTAMNAFALKYDYAIPGDFEDASSYNLGTDGNGDRRISDCEREGLYAWQHLGNAGMIKGEYTGALSGGHHVINTNIPPSSFDNTGYLITHIDSSIASSNCMFFDSEDLFGTIDNKNIITVGGLRDAGSYPNSIGVLTVYEAHGIDAKMDDGKPDSGRVFSANTGNENVDGSRCVDNNVQGNGGANYDFDETGEDCRMFFVIPN